MTILQRSTFVGTNHQDVRPGAYTETATVEGIIKDQAYLYERLTALTVPSAGSAAAAGHDHTGNGDGAIFRMPICQQYLSALLLRQAANPVQSSTNYAGWSKLIYHPFYCEPGLDRMMCVLWVDRETFAYGETFRAIMLDSTLAKIGTHQVSNGLRDYLVSENDKIGMVFTLETNPGQINVLSLEAWDGFYHPTVPVDTTSAGQLLPEFRRIMSFSISPEIKRPNKQLQSYTPNISNTANVQVPTTYIPFDSALVSDDVGLSSYHLVNISKDDAMLQEIATNKPAANRSSQTVSGHNHQGVSSPDGSGKPLNRTIGSWFYGTVRPASAAQSTYYNTTSSLIDVIGGGLIPSVWTGGVNAITITSAAGTTARTVARHLFRMPELTSAALTGGSGNINAVLLVSVDASKSNLTVGVSIGNQSGTVYGTESTQTITTTGRHVITLSKIDASVLSSGGAIGTIKITMKNSSNSNGSSFLYGASLFYL